MAILDETIYILPELRFGGIQIFALDMAYHQVSHGAKVKIFSIGKSTAALNRYSSKKKEALKKVIFLTNIFKIYAYLLKSLILMRSVNIHTQGHLLTYFGIFSCFKNFKMVHTIQNQAEYEVGKKRRIIHSFYFNKMSVLTVSNSKEIAKSFRSYYGFDSNHTIMNGIDFENLAISEIKPKILKGNDTHVSLLTIGSFGHHKNQKLLIESFIAINDPNCSLYIIGKNYNNYLDSRYLENIKKYSIHLLGEINNSFEYMDKCNIFCMSSRNEGLPLVLMEAKLKNMIVVTTDTGGSKEIIDKNDFLVDVGDVDGYKKALEKSIKKFRKKSIKPLNKHSANFFKIQRCFDEYLDIWK